MSNPTPPGPDPQGTHHWVMSVQWPGERHTPANSATYGGTTTPTPGETRAQVYERIRDHVYQDLSTTLGVQGPTIVHWSLEPNQLGGAA